MRESHARGPASTGISMGVRIKKRAAQFGVEIPEGFASFDVKPRSSKKYLLKPTL